MFLSKISAMMLVDKKSIQRGMSSMEEASLIQLLEQRLRFSKRIQQADAAVLIAITQEPQPSVLLTRRSIQYQHLYAKLHSLEHSSNYRFELNSYPP